ncbi:MAG: PAS domain S-box protein [Deltaproteobacteria bacterium]|nr:PAS domain S-box protein [Deltaproteobacteria bacterium]
MLKKSLIIITNLVARGKWASLYRVLFVLLFVFPGLLLVFFSYTRLYSESTASILAEKRLLALLASNSVHDRLNAIVDLGISFATRPRVVEEIEKGNWAEARQVLDSVPATFPFIDRLVLYDPDAIIKADIPYDPEVMGQSRADKGWYAGIRKNWQPYVSDIYKRAAKPQQNVIAVVFPIRKAFAAAAPLASPSEKEGRVIGILQVQLKLEIFQEWIRRTNVGPGGFMYIVDQRGRIVAHPSIDNQKVSIDFSAVPVVQKVLQGKGGAEFNYNPVEKEERFAVYAPVKRHGWGVVMTQPARDAFRERNKELLPLLIIYLLFVALTMVTAFFILYAMIAGRQSREASRQLAAIVASSADAIIGKDRDGMIVSWNAGAEQMYGYASREAIGKSIFMLAVDDLSAEEMAQWLQRLNSGEKIENYETLRRKKDGGVIHVALTISPIKNELGQIEGSSTIARDITSRKLAEKEREELLASLQDALANVKTLHGMLPICSACNKIRNDEGYWERIETYIRERSDAEFTHGICPDCAKKLYPQFYKK